MDTDDWCGDIGAAQLDPDLPTPLYHQIYLMLRERIRAGRLAAGAMLPGEQELAKLFNVSRITVKRSLNELASDGLVSRHRGRGTVVAAGRAVPVVKGSFSTLMHSLRVMGLETEVELIEVADIAADTEIARHLRLAPGSKVQRAVRRRKIENEPFSYLISFVPSEIAAGYSVEELAATSLLSLLERAGAAAQSAEQWITAVEAEPQIAAALNVAPAAALLRIERVMRAAKGRPVQLIYAYYRPDRFQYHLKTQKTRSADGDSWQEES
jgi:GntR family transcriptional regulator